jgi:lysophospholipase
MADLLPEPRVEYDIASWPNPFYGVAPETFIDTAQTNLNLVDGGEDGETIPLQPLLVKPRGVDVIFAIDAVSGFYERHDLQLILKPDQRY